MASFVHLYFAERIIEKMPVGAKSVVKLYPDAYYVGALGADALNDLGRLKAEMDVSDAFDLFNDAAAYIFTTGLKSQLSYMLGMLSHYVIDSRLNPYIMHLVEHGAPHYYDDDKSTLTKKEVENGLDYYVVRAYLENRIDSIKKLEVRDFVANDIAELYRDAVFRSVKHSIDATKVKNCLTNLKLVENLPVDMLNIDYMNVNKNVWTTVRNGDWTTDMSLEEFFDKMEPITIKLISDYMDRARSSIELNPKAFYVSFTGIFNK